MSCLHPINTCLCVACSGMWPQCGTAVTVCLSAAGHHAVPVVSGGGAGGSDRRPAAAIPEQVQVSTATRQERREKPKGVGSWKETEGYLLKKYVQAGYPHMCTFDLCTKVQSTLRVIPVRLVRDRRRSVKWVHGARLGAGKYTD